MKIPIHKRTVTLLAATLIATFATVGLVKAMAVRQAARVGASRVVMRAATGEAKGAPSRAAVARAVPVPWELRERRRYEGLRIWSEDKSPLEKQIAAALMRQEFVPPLARVKCYQWLFEPPRPGELIGHPLQDHHKVHIYGWDGAMIAASEIPGGWRATINVVPRIEAAWHHCPIVVALYREEYVCQDGQITLTQSYRPDPHPGEWPPSVTTPRRRARAAAAKRSMVIVTSADSGRHEPCEGHISDSPFERP
ncbi:MAG TPA: hypothetical protein VGZ22_02135 [Isosphaeraceae bacterium]|jgi:hypothetical protein|nr:hypothetical protein [Isosphaeraceae bacterium]